jgi:hypothetical protein
MLPKSRESFGRTRTTPRTARRAPVAVDSQAARLAAARQVAARFVAARWPALADVEPVVTVRLPHQPSAQMLARLGLAAEEAAPHPAGVVEYTFTFTRDDEAVDTCAPLVAVVTVDEHQRIVKTSASK